jgi:hypothetical protein
MTSSTVAVRRFLLPATLIVSVAGCSVISDFGRYTPRGGADGGMDGGTSDGGRDDGGMTDGGPTGCDPACAEGETCDIDVCRCGAGTSCGTGQACCSDACQDLDTIFDCGACGVRCALRTNFTPTCDATAGCGGACNERFGDCDGDPATGCEASLSARETCGDCGTACAAGELCQEDTSGASCVSSCTAGLVECSGSCVDLGSSILHCGGCDNACPVGSMASGATCSGGTCAAVCVAGYSDCDADPSNGCEMLQRFYQDSDGDGFGDAASSMLACPGATPSGYSVSNTDCDDGAGGVHPGATEICNGVNDNCTGGVDEGFECTGSGTRTCTVAGCSTTGTQICNAATCTYGACTITETCNRADDDCDGFVDESVIARGATATPVTFDPTSQIRAAWDPTRDQVGVVYGQRIGASTTVWFQRLRNDGSALGTPVRVSTNGVDWDVAWDGAQWSVAHIEPPPVDGVIVTRVNASDSVTATTSMPVFGMTSPSPTMVRLDGAGSGSGAPEVVAVIWTAAMSTGAYAKLAAVQYTAAGGPSILFTNQLDSSGGARSMGWPFAVRTATDCVVGFSHWRESGGGMTEIDVYHVDPASGGVSPRMIIASEPMIEERTEAAYDPSGRLIGFTFQRRDPAGGALDSYLLIVDEGGFATRHEERLGSGLAGEQISAANDASFGIIHSTSSTPTFERRRANDGMLIPGSRIVLAAGSFRHMLGFGSGPTHYMNFGAGGSMKAEPMVCTP